jgi:hypothetical protein
MEYDPDDQFFQAYAAGYRQAARSGGRWVPGPQYLWGLYVEWLHEQPVKAVA